MASSYESSPINSLGLFEADGTYNESDMNQFFETFAPYVPVGTEPIPAPINNAVIQQGKLHPSTNGETELDLQIMYPIVYPQTITLYQISPKRYEDTFDGFPLAIQDFLDALDASFCDVEPPNQGHDCGIYVPKRVISMSYGVSELVQPEKYMVRLCNEFMKLGKTASSNARWVSHLTNNLQVSKGQLSRFQAEIPVLLLNPENGRLTLSSVTAASLLEATTKQ